MTFDPRALGARCDLCPLRDKTPVPPQHPASGKLRLVIVGMAPGHHEVRVGAPFVGKSGLLLDQTLDLAKLSRKDCYVTNACLCKPDGDKQEEVAALYCSPRLLRELAELPAKVPILALGKTATRSILNVGSVLKARGFIWTTPTIDDTRLKDARKRALKAKQSWKCASDIKTARRKANEYEVKADALTLRAQLAGRTVVPSIHPAFVLRADTWKPVMVVDIKRVARWARGELTAEDLKDKAPFKVVTGVQCKREILRMKEDISIDIETGGLDWLTTEVRCVSVSDGTTTIVIHPWKDIYARILISAVRKKRAVVMHNGFNADQIALERTGSSFGDNVEDTLAAYHAYASHLPKSLDHVVSVYVDSGPWKAKARRGGAAEEKGLAPQHMEVADLLKYNAADARLTILAWHAMQRDLADEREVYETNKAVLRMCKGMIVSGFPVDLDRQRELAEKLKRRCAALKGEMRRLLKWKTFAPSKPNDVRKALFTRLRAPMLFPTSTGLPSTASQTLEELKKLDTRAGKAAGLILDWRVADKVKSTYVEGLPVGTDGRVHPDWKIGPVTGRLACRFQSNPRLVLSRDARALIKRGCPLAEVKATLGGDTYEVDSRVREQYVAPKGYRLLYFDASQVEMRLAAYLSDDPNFIKSCQGDIHSNNALVLFPEAADDIKNDIKGRGKPFRDIAKNAGFAVSYLAEAETVFVYLNAKGFRVRMEQVVAMLDRIHLAYKRYYDYCSENIAFVQRHGYMRTPIAGRIRWLGYFPKPTEVSNTPIQGGLADIMNIRLPELVNKRLPKGANILLAQIHDAAIFAVKHRLVDTAHRIIKQQWEEEVVTLKGQRFVLPIDQKDGDRWSDFG